MMNPHHTGDSKLQHQIQSNPIRSIYVYLLSFDLMVKEGLGLLMRNSWEWGQGLPLNWHLLGCELSCTISTLPCAASILSFCDSV